MWDTLVVGGGSAGCALAGRLTDGPLADRGGGPTGRRVLLLEAGPLRLPPELLEAASLAGTDPGHPWNWAHPVQLRRGHGHVVPRGRGLGGSSAINGANWTRMVPADAPHLPGWTWPELLALYVRSENDLDLGDRPGHGASGPVPVSRPRGRLLHPAAERFLDAAARLGYPEEADKNDGGPPGAGLCPGNTRDGRRVNAAMAYLRGERSGLTVRGGATVRRLLIDRTRVRGVELTDGRTVQAAETVLAAGGVGTPQLLLASGIGPADELRAAGIRVVADRPGVGRNWSDHPAVFLPLRDTDPAAHPHAPSAQAALNLDAGADPPGDVEVLLFVRPFSPGGDLHLMCALQRPDSRGVITLPDPAGPPLIRYRYLRTEHDRRRLRHAVRTGAELLRAGLGERTDPTGGVLGNDRTLDGWIAGRLSTSVHLCGSAAMGDADDPDAVVGSDLRVHGVDGLRVADTSVLPVVPRRGPAASAVAIGERAADLIGGTAGWRP